jgi:hypothetical protein
MPMTWHRPGPGMTECNSGGWFFTRCAGDATRPMVGCCCVCAVCSVCHVRRVDGVVA